jgi:putative porin
MVFLFLVIAVLWGGPAMAQEKSLVDILQAKGVLSKKEAQQLRKGTTAKTGGADQQALINLLRKKGILEADDLAQLQAPPAPAAGAPAPTSPEVTQRLSHLETKQQQLEAQAQAQAEQQAKAAEDFRRTAVADVKKNIDWLSRISLFGDIRIRHEGFFQDGVAARNQERFRLRVGARIQVSDEFEGGFRLVSGDPNNIISNNQTMTDVFTRKPISIDTAYITVHPSTTIGLEKPFFSITGGKFVSNFFRPRAIMLSELVFDEDLTTEGAAEEVTLLEGQGIFRNLKLLGGQWALKEVSTGPDSYMVGEQALLNLAPTPISQLALAVGDYYFLNSKLVAQERNRNSQLTMTNSVRLQKGQVIPGGDLIVPSTTNPIQSFVGGFNIVDVAAQLNIDTRYPRWPVSLMFNFAHNMQADLGKDNAYLFGAGVGQTKNPGDWAVSALWERVETDSVISMFTLSDYGRRGGTNVEGPIAKIDYMLFPRLTLTTKGYFVNFIDRPKGLTNSMVNRLQFDALFAF